MSVPRGPSPDYLQMLRGEISSEEYIERLRIAVFASCAEFSARNRRGSRWAAFSNEELEDLTRTEPLIICNADLLDEIDAELERRITT